MSFIHKGANQKSSVIVVL